MLDDALRASSTRFPSMRSKAPGSNSLLRSDHLVLCAPGWGPTTEKPICLLNWSFLRLTVAWSVPCAMALPVSKSWFAMVAWTCTQPPSPSVWTVTQHGALGATSLHSR